LSADAPPSARRGIPFLVAAPSGTGKTTVCQEVLKRDPMLRFSVSHTTRAPREGELDGCDYHFVSAAEFRKLNADGAFLEHAEYAGNLYGTSWAALEGPLAEGHDLLVEIEVQGARQVRERRDDVRFIFLLPPSLAELERRLASRGTDSAEAIDKRLALVDRELEAAIIFDYAVVNDELGDAVGDVVEIIAAERAGDTAEVSARHGRAGVLERWRRLADLA
jgi:guanylate kinase